MFELVPLERWTLGRVTLLGDAVNPFYGSSPSDSLLTSVHPGPCELAIQWRRRWHGD
jgi:hypothetical protein